MKIYNKRIKITSLFMAMLIASMVFVQAVNAKADGTQNNPIDYSSKYTVSAEKLISKNADVLKKTDNETVVSIKKDDGSIVYGVFWKDKTNPNRVDFAFVDPKELVSNKLVSTANLNDNSVVVEAILASSYNFWHGSYSEGYGNAITGGVHIYLSERDATLIVGGVAGAAGILGTAIASVFTKNATIAEAVGGICAFAVGVVYWDEQNSDGSLDIWIPYANLIAYPTAHCIVMKIGDGWYTF